jgi:DNA-directed RNA polymerase specialized sigma24 family protein
MTLDRKKKSPPPKMAATSRLPEYREFVKENGEKLYHFCYLLLPLSVDAEEFVLAALRDFGDNYRRWAKSEEPGEISELRCKLFKLAWERTKDVLSRTQAAWTVGRDTREVVDIDRDLLIDWAKQNRNSTTKTETNLIDEKILDRMRWVDPDFRAPFILRDLIGLADEDVVRVLGLRWGVYRNRLNRGRLDLKECLKGRPISSSNQSSFKEASW